MDLNELVKIAQGLKARNQPAATERGHSTKATLDGSLSREAKEEKLQKFFAKKIDMLNQLSIEEEEDVEAVE